jgi:hypothetical protein
MKHGGLVVAILGASLWAFAQSNGQAGAGTQATPATGGTQSVMSATPASAAAPVQPAGVNFRPAGAIPVLNTQTGTAFVNVPPSPPALVTPVGHLGTPAPVIGASNATPGNNAGAVNSTMSLVSGIAPLPLTGEVAYQAPVVLVGEQPSTSPYLQATSGVTVSGTVNPGVPFNVGVGSSSGPFAVGTMAGNRASLGEIAREYRSRRAAEQARTFTNEDIQQMNQATGVNVVGGTSGAITAPSGSGTMTQPSETAPAVAQPETTPAVTPGVARPMPPPQANPPQQPPMSQMQSEATSTEMAQATPPSGMQGTPAAAAGAQRRGQLPHASSVLPLMALVGFLAAAAGLLAR